MWLAAWRRSLMDEVTRACAWPHLRTAPAASRPRFTRQPTPAPGPTPGSVTAPHASYTNAVSLTLMLAWPTRYRAAHGWQPYAPVMPYGYASTTIALERSLRALGRTTAQPLGECR